MFLVGIFSVVVWQWIVAICPTRFFGGFANGRLFSVGLLLKTLFNPFRQISAAPVGGAAPVQLSAFFDKLFSRAVGMVVRSCSDNCWNIDDITEGFVGDSRNYSVASLAVIATCGNCAVADGVSL